MHGLRSRNTRFLVRSWRSPSTTIVRAESRTPFLYGGHNRRSGPRPVRRRFCRERSTMARTDAVVLAAGIVGTSIALHLAKRGLSVALVDKGQPGEGTSYGNAGVIES